MIAVCCVFLDGLCGMPLIFSADGITSNESEFVFFALLSRKVNCIMSKETSEAVLSIAEIEKAQQLCTELAQSVVKTIREKGLIELLNCDQLNKWIEDYVEGYLVGRIKAKLITAQRMVKSEGFNTESIYSYVGVTKEQQLCLQYLDDIRQDA